EMPREQVEWYAERSLKNGDEQLHGQQHCSYYSIVNVNKSNYPYSSSYEHEQTWTLTRTMSHYSKRYQSSIENIHLTVPCTTSVPKATTNAKINHHDHDFDNIQVEQSLALIPPCPSTRQHGLSPPYPDRSFAEPKIQNKANAKTNSIIENPPSTMNLMRIMRINGDFIVRI
ncbi:unnamed protein product, partial [Adineta ricciae]